MVLGRRGDEKYKLITWNEKKIFCKSNNNKENFIRF